MRVERMACRSVKLPTLRRELVWEMMLRIFEAIVGFFLPAGALRDFRSPQRFVVSIRAFLIITVIASISAPAYLFFFPDASLLEIVLILLGAAAPLVGALIVKFSASLTSAVLIANLVGVAVLAYFCWLTGGILSPVIPWFLGCLALVSGFGDLRVTVIITAAMLSAIVAMYVGAELGLQPESLVHEDNRNGLHFVGIIGTALLVAIAVFSTAAARRHTRRKLAAALLEAQMASEAKSRFLSNMSHELRTPLNAVLGFAQVLQADTSAPLTDRQRASVDHIRTGGEHLLSLISDILDMTRIEEDQMRFDIDDVDLAPVVAECLAMAEPLASKAAIAIEVEPVPDTCVRADPTRLKQIVFNLLGNAIKYNRENGKVSVDVVAHQAGRVRIRVRDTGPGIAEDLRAELFQPFHRLPNTTTVDGLGIGLALSRRIARMMKGDVNFQSTPGQGSVFWLELPVAELDATA